MNIVYHPTHYEVLHLYVNESDMSIYKTGQFMRKSYLWKGKMLWFGCTDNPVNTTYWNVDIFGCNAARYPYLYVTPECSLSRDSIRNSGFRIVRDKEKASLIVVPSPEFVCKQSYDIAAVLGDNDVRLCKITAKDFIVWNESAIQLLCDNLIETLGWATVNREDIKFFYNVHNNKIDDSWMFSTNRCAEYKEIVENSKDIGSNSQYCFETTLELIPSIEVNPDLFKVWNHCDNRQVLQDSLQQCDWKKYPITLANYLARKKDSIYYGASSSVNLILKEIGFFTLHDKKVLHKVVQPEDWNMLQKCMLAEYNLPDTGGYIKTDAIGCNFALSRRYALKPIYITEPADYADLMELVQNS